MIKLQTARLILRHFAAADWKDLMEYLCDETVVAYEPYECYSQEECILEAKRRAADCAYWAICLKSTGKLIGNLYLEEQDQHSWELGCILNRNYQHRGYAAEASLALMTYAVENWEARRFTAICNSHNTDSWQFLERLGMRREAHFIQHIYFHIREDGTPDWQDTFEYAILANELKIKNFIPDEISLVSGG